MRSGVGKKAFPRRAHCCVCAVLVFTLSRAILAQAPAGAAVAGRVSDPAEAAVPGARVAVVGGGETTTDVDGAFTLPLAPGNYTIRVGAEGFLEVSREVLSSWPPEPVEIKLQIRPQTESVSVTDAATYQARSTASATRTQTPLTDVPQSVSVVPSELVRDQMMMSIADAVKYVPGITAVQGENNRDQLVIRGNNTSADFFVNGLRDDVQYYRDLYNTERLEAIKGPNAMIFGRGGGGGVINRVTKEAGFTSLHEIEVQAGSFGHKRAAADFDKPWGERSALRLNSVYENSGSFRDGVSLERYGLNPTITLAGTSGAGLRLGYEYFQDGRTADRGVPSYAGQPAAVPVSRFFGDPRASRVRAGVHLGSAVMEVRVARLSIRNSTLAGDYDRGYQNFVPGAVSADQTRVAMSAYNNAARRRNVFNQTDVTCRAATGFLRHTLLWGAEEGWQDTDNFRNTGYFEGAATSISVPYQTPRPAVPVVFRQSPTDAHNHVRATVLAGYLQDQMEVTRLIRLVAGVRLDRFRLNYFNRRTGANLERVDRLLSPRAGLIVKPAAALSVYGSYSVSWLPSSGDQFSSLTNITQQMKPEKFSNYETGVKWDLRGSLSLTAAVYRLDRTNTRSTDPNDPTRILQTGSQRTNGVEIGWNGGITSRWQVAGGYAWQDAFIRTATAAAGAGSQAPQAPHHTFSFWNNCRVLSRLSAGLGILNRSNMFAAVDNTVTLPGYVRFDAAAYYEVTERVRLQLNVQNVFNTRYYAHADGNNNISPGSPRGAQLGLVARF